MASTRELDDPRRRLLVAALSLGWLGAAPGARAQNPLGGRPGKLPEGRSVYRVRGEVTVDGRRADESTRIAPGSTVKTARDSEVVFVVGSHAMIARGQTAVVLQPAPREGIVGALKMLEGALLSVSRGTVTSVKTNVATIGLRGTGFYVEAHPDHTYFCTCYGVSDVASIEDATSRQTIEARHHDRPVYVLAQGDAGTRVRNAPFINHTDQELALIEALVGREPPFVFPNDAYSAPRRSY